MSTRIQVRRGTAAAWTAANPILAVGEPALETDTDLTKIGDGATPWVGLPYRELKLGVTGTTAAAGDDPRLGDARTPTAHKTSHGTGGLDPITPAMIGAEVAGAAAAVTVSSIGAATPASVTAAVDPKLDGPAVDAKITAERTTERARDVSIFAPVGKAITTPGAFAINSSKRVVPGSAFFYRPIGHFAAATVMWFFRSGSAIFQTDNYGTSWSAGRTLPAGVTADQVVTVQRLGAFDYMLGNVAGTWSVYRAASVTMNANWSGWSGVLASLTAGSNTLGNLNLIATAWGANDVLVLSDYGDPVGGPTIKVSTDGTTWTTRFGPDATIRHIHHVNWDPYTPGTLYATVGDNMARTIMRSVDYGVTWTTIVANTGWQGVQISFTPTHLYIGGDSMQATVIRMKKSDLAMDVPSLNHHRTIATTLGVGGRRVGDLVTTAGSQTATSATAAFTAQDVGRYVSSFTLPAGTYITTYSSPTQVTLSQQAFAASTAQAYISGDCYYANAYLGAVDPATGIYYCMANDTSNAGTMRGVFFLAKTGDVISVLDPGAPGLPSFGPSCMIAGGFLWAGDYKYPLLTMG